MEPQTQVALEHRAHLGVECPQCHFRQVVEVDSDLVGTWQDSKAVQKIYAELEAWMRSRCPEHLRAILETSKN